MTEAERIIWATTFALRLHLQRHIYDVQGEGAVAPAVESAGHAVDYLRNVEAEMREGYAGTPTLSMYLDAIGKRRVTAAENTDLQGLDIHEQ